MKNLKIENNKKELRVKSEEYKSKGITLIALVITIIVLLILAAVTLNLVLGENGIITKATMAKELTNKQDIIERLELSALDAISANNGREITKENLEKALTNNFKEEYTLTGENAPYTVIINGIEYTIDENGRVTQKGENTSNGWKETEEGITNGKVTLQIGDYVNYDEGTGYTYKALSNKRYRS